MTGRLSVNLLRSAGLEKTGLVRYSQRDRRFFLTWRPLTRVRFLKDRVCRIRVSSFLPRILAPKKHRLPLVMGEGLDLVREVPTHSRWTSPRPI